MYKFQPLTEATLQTTAQIQIDAYPGFAQGMTLENYAERISESNKRPDVDYYCVYNGDKVVGCFNIWDFNMNMRSSMIKAGGIGSIAVDLCHKKEKVCKEAMTFFIDYLRKNGANMALLYPFNSAFYHKMGFGFGTLLHQLRIKPDDLPGGPSKAHITRLTQDDADRLAHFYNSRVGQTHGLIKKSPQEFATRIKLPANKTFGYTAPSGDIRGYVQFQHRKGSDESVLVNDMYITELLFDSPEVFAELMAFIKSQSDQVRYVIINTQDEGLINTIPDPRNHMDRMLFSVYQEVCRTGLGIMYRICDVAGFIKDISNTRFGDLNMKLQLNVTDSFVPDNNRPFLLEFKDGQCRLAPNTIPDAELNIGIADLSSLVLGCVNLKPLVKYGKVTLSDSAYLDALSRAFSVDEKPICLTHF